MTSLLKNQILKHLSRFTKNLSPDKISLSALRGEGELANLELDETVLMDILELPTWLRLSKAICNRVGIKIQWTKLKTQPICLYLDEVVLEVETCENPRPPNNPQVASLRPGKYGFVERVIDGIYVHINSVQVFFLSKTFQACLQMSRVKVHSVSPTWHATTDLRLTRIKDVSRGEVLIFKEVDWQATRIEAQAVDPHAKGVITQTPIRLIANQAKLRIAVKKNINDCSIVSSRVILLLDDLLWVLTETQLKAALLYATSLQEVIEKSTHQSKQLAAEKLKKQGHIVSDQLKRLQQMKQNKAIPTSKVSRVFTKFDVLSTSYHLITSRIDLHLCDDMQPRKDSSPTHNSRIEGGAMQITLNKLSLDFYPFNPAGGERKQWYRYSDQVGSRNHWVGQLFAGHKEEVRRAKVAYGLLSPSQSPTHISEQAANSSSSSTCSSSSLSSTSGATSKLQTSPTVSNVGDKSPGFNSSSTMPSQGRPPTSGSGSSSGGGGRTTSRLLESCIVLEIEEFTIYCISTADQKRNNPHKFFSSERKVLHLPHDMPIIHLEYTEYYFPEGIDFPVPHANLYALVNPVQLRIDYLTLLWVNYFLLQLSKNLKEGADGPREHVDIKFEALMPKILIHAESGSHHHSSERPDTLLIQMSKISATNNRAEPHASRDKLLSVLNEQSKSHLYKSSEFPMDDNVKAVCPQQVCAHALSKDSIDAYIDPEIKRILTNYKSHLPQTDYIPAFPIGPNGERLKLRTNSLKLDSAYDVWNMDIDQIWMDFTTRRSRPVPFVESFPVTLWFWRTLPSCRSKASTGTQKDVIKNGDVTRERSSSQESSSSDHGKKIDDHFSLSSPHSSTLSSKSHDRSESPPVVDSHSRSSSCDRSPLSSGPTQSSAPRCVLSGKRDHMDIYAIACVRTKVQVLLTHYQYLFILRLLESLSTFQKQLSADTEYFSGNSISSTVSLTSIVHDVEVAMVFQKPSDSNNHSGNVTGGLSGTIKGSIAELPTIDKNSAMEGWNNAESDNYDDSVGLISKSYSDSRLNLSKQEIMNGELQIQSAQMETIHTSDLSLESNNQMGVTLNCTDISSSTQSLSHSIAYSAASDTVYSTSSGVSSDAKSVGGSLGLRKGSIKMEKKKTLSSAWSNFTDKLRSMGELNDDSLFGSEDSEPGQTDYSSDDESFEHLSLEDAEETPAFERKRNLDPQGSFDSMSHDSSSETLSTAREKLQIHVTVFHLSELEVLAQSFGVGSVLRAQLNNIDVIELSGFTWEGFHRKFTSSQGLQYESVSMSDKPFPVKLKYMIGSGLPALKYDVIAQERGFLHVNLADMRLTFQMSTLINLADLLEDELPPVFMPLYINIEDLTLTLQEDRPSSSSPMTPPPTVLSLHQSIVDRGADGVFHVRGANNIPVKIGANEDKTDKVEEKTPAASHSAAISNSNRIIEQLWRRNLELEKNMEETKNEASQKLEQLQAELVCLQTENEQLKHVSEKYFSLSDRVEHVESIESENLKLLERISYLEEEVQTSNKEKDSLLATMHLLQEELLVSEQQRSVIQQQMPSPNQ